MTAMIEGLRGATIWSEDLNKLLPEGNLIQRLQSRS
jgi:hypothetical protein